MDPNIKARFQDSHLAEAGRHYGVAPGAFQPLDGFESFIYQFSRADGDYILRIGHSRRRSPEQIHAEVDWINYLAAGMGPANGIPAAPARAIQSQNGQLVEAIPDGQGEYFLATAFVRAQGQTPRGAMLTPPFFENYGRMLGRIHSLSRRYQPADPAWVRPHWNDPGNLVVAEYLPPGNEGVIERFQHVMDHLTRLPRTVDSYGMIHQDAHAGNLFADADNNLTLFDFDDCCFGYYIYDIAMVIFYAAQGRPDPEGFTREFLPPFLHGYRRECPLDPSWLAEIPPFLKLREIDLYALIHRSLDVNNLPDSWTSNYMNGRKARIEAAQPFIDLDFTTFG
jgi:amicoumacin kinase